MHERRRQKFGRRAFRLAGFAIAASLFAAVPAQAGTVPVTTTADQYGKKPSDCSLREAVVATNTDADFGGCNDTDGDDAIRLGAHSYQLTREGNGEDAAKKGDLDVTDNLQIRGAGMNDTDIDGNGARFGDRILEAHGTLELTVRDFTLHDAKLDADSGGAIRSTGGTLVLKKAALRDNFAQGGSGALRGSSTNVSITHSVVRGNSADMAAGAIGTGAGTLTITRSDISHNVTGLFGGGVYTNGTATTIERSTLRGNQATPTTGGDGAGIAQLGGSLSVRDSVISKNTGTDGGGGIYGFAAPVTISNSTVSGNTAHLGGGVFSEVSSSQLNVDHSTISDNLAKEDGGGVDVKDGTANIDDSTISGNRARGNGGGVNVGDTSTDVETTLNNTTVADNRADSDAVGGGSGGGLFRTSGVIYIYNSIVGDNEVTGPPAEPDCDGGIAVAYSLIENECLGIGDHNIVGEDPALKPLADNGGPTKTQALEATSQAVGSADPATPGSTETACIPDDQRGEPRPGGTVCDMGAFERQN